MASAAGQDGAQPVSPPAKVMFPLMLDVSGISIIAIGGAEILPRVTAMLRHGATDLHVFAPSPAPELISAAGHRLHSRWPTEADFASLKPKLVFVADADEELAASFHALARAAGALVHVHDRIPLCDFHLPAIVRRGHLQVTVSTDGTAAGLSRHIREYLETYIFRPEWSAHVDEVAAARRTWKQEGLSFGALGKAVADLVTMRGWLRKP
jgi:precorrin-2 dehydrogenase / sirohydrochlorin ferrochelatase